MSIASCRRNHRAAKQRKALKARFCEGSATLPLLFFHENSIIDLIATPCITTNQTDRRLFQA